RSPRAPEARHISCVAQISAIAACYAGGFRNIAPERDPRVTSHKTLGRKCVSRLSFAALLRRNAGSQISHRVNSKPAMPLCGRLLRRLTHETNTNDLVVVDTRMYRSCLRTRVCEYRAAEHTTIAASSADSSLDCGPRSQHDRKAGCRRCRSHAG